MPSRPERPADAGYYERDRLELFSQGDLFRDVPLAYPLPADELVVDEAEGGGSRRFLSGPLGCRVLDSVAEEQRRLWSARRHETLNAARTAAIRQLQREGLDGREDAELAPVGSGGQSRGVPHLHFVLGHTTALEKAFARTFFRELKSAAYSHGLGHTSTYEKAVLEQGKYEAGRLRNYVSKFSRYLSKGEDAAAFLLRHSGERVFYVAPWLSRLSGMTMTVARLARRVWAARKGFCEMPKMTAEQKELVMLLLDPVVCAPNAP